MIINDWIPETGTASCIISDTINNITLEGFGMAQCHLDDEPFKSELTGAYIAEARARINILCKKRDYDAKPALMALKHLQSTIINSKYYNKDSYETKRLRKEIKNKEEEIIYLNNLIKEERESLKIYLTHKNATFDELRKGKNN